MKKIFTTIIVSLMLVLTGNLYGQDGLFISEVADPGDDFDGRFVELYNPTGTAIDFGTDVYHLVRQANGGSFGDIPLTGTIEAGTTFIIANNATNFESLYGFAPDMASGNISGNGDDGYILYANGDETTGTLVDIYGEIDVEGTGEAWEYENSHAVRVPGITAPNTTWTAAEWEISSADIADCTPGEHGDSDPPVVTFTPADATTDVLPYKNITLAFDEPVYTSGGVEITDASSLVELRETDASGTAVSFSATINDANDLITIDPDADLANDQQYYVALKANMVEDAAGNAIDAVKAATFTTISSATPVVELTYPEGGEVFYIGEEVHIDWYAANVGDISIYISFDGGTNWEPFIENMSPGLGTIAFPIPEDSDASQTAVLRIAEASDVNFDGPYDDSETFSVLPLVSIYDIQSDPVYEDSVCMITGVVTYADAGNEYYISDGTGDFSAVVVNDGDHTPTAGDSILIAGEVYENYGLTTFGNLIYFENIEGGKTIPDPVDVSTGDAGEALEGVIVKLSSAEVVGITNYGEYEVDDGTGVVLVDDPYYSPDLNIEGTYDITGPLSYAYGSYRVNPTSSDDVVEIPSSEASVSSEVYTVDQNELEITGVPALETLEDFKGNIDPVYGATFEVYEADGTTVATDLQTNYQLKVTSQDGNNTVTYAVTKDQLSDDASVTSSIYTVDDGAGTITGVLFKTTVEAFEQNLEPAAGATIVIYEADGTTVATDLQSDYILEVTAEDGTTTKTYTITVDGEPGELIFSEYIEGSSNNKALEIFNPSEEAVNLAYYQIAQLSNGGDDWEYFHEFTEGAILGPQENYVIITDQVDGGLFASEDADEVLSYPSPVHHNGDDARGLVLITSVDTTLVDIIGELGPDPGTGWDVAGITNATANHTLLRKGNISSGNTDWTASAGTDAADSEWIVKEQDYFDSLGYHTLLDSDPTADATLSEILVDSETLEGFTSLSTDYEVTLPAGTTTVPTVSATTTNPAATVDIVDATDLTGDEAARTTTITVTAENGITTNEYTILFVPIIEVANLGELRTATDFDRTYKVTGEVFLTFQQDYRNKKYVQDATGGIEIDDDPGVITSTYAIADGITGLEGTLEDYNGLLQFHPTADPGAATSSDNDIAPAVVTLADINADIDAYESMLVKVESVSFADADGSATFENGSNYDIEGLSESMVCRVHFYGTSLTGTVIPDSAHVTGIVLEYDGTAQISPRSADDVEELIEVVLSDDATLSDIMVDGSSIPDFSPALMTYTYTLPPGTTDVPAVTAETTDENASVAITDATDLAGDEAARTTTIEVTAEDGETTKTYSVIFDVEVGIGSDLFSGVRIYPVPANEQLHLEEVGSVSSIRVYDITGTMIMNTENDGQTSLTLDISHLSAGVYMLRMESGTESGVVRFVKK